MSYGMGSTGMNPQSTNTAMNQMKEKIPSGYSKGSLQQFTPEQMQLFSQLFGHLGPDSYLSKLASGDQSTFGEIEAPALQQFAGLQEGIANKFSGAGLGGRRSSGFQNAQTSAASQFAQQLQAQRQGLQRQALSDLMGFSNQLLGQRPYENFLEKKEESPWARSFGKLFGALPGAIAGYAKDGSKGAGEGIAGGFDVLKSIPGFG